MRITDILILTFLLSTNTAIAEKIYTGNAYTYEVDFDNPASQSRLMGDIQHQVDTTESGLNIILFGNGLALYLDTNVTRNTRLEYGTPGPEIQEKIKKLETQGVNFIICTAPSSNKRHYSTGTSKVAIDTELQRLKAAGYGCGKIRQPKKQPE
ncbi:MAG TPA: hypothetical protein ENJ87_04635 [Gammaproteobacteria bacterium]|nr:hypothetical protein [Gammaproteobacteria bacterium]